METQSPLIQAMLRPQTYDHRVTCCRLIETHISWVILTGEYVYKIKKPVDLGFLNFSTLDKRKFYCEEELRLNRRLAPQLYLDLVPICGSEASPVLYGDGPAFEYAVKMREFPQEAQLDRLHDQGRLSSKHIDSLAVLIAQFHQRIEVAGGESEYGEPRLVLKAIIDTIDIFMQNAPAYRQRIESLQSWVNQQYKILLPVLQQRKRDGYVRECHGDMHLRNLAWVDDAPVVFDCIEFNPNLIWNDVMSELAFLIMDLEDRKEAALAQRCLNRYLEYTGDYSGLKVFDFYRVYRALVRGMVAAIRLSQQDIAPRDRQAAEAEVEEYLQLAMRYTQTNKTQLIITHGVSGSGKSFLSESLLESLPAIRLRSDIERKRLYGVAIDEDASQGIGEGIYNKEATRKTYDHLLKMVDVVLAAGFSVIVDATFQSYEQRKLFRRLAQKNSVPFVILDLHTDETILRQRVAQRQNDVSDADVQVLEYQLANRAPLRDSEADYALRVDTNEAVDVGDLLGRIRLFKNVEKRVGVVT